MAKDVWRTEIGFPRNEGLNAGLFIIEADRECGRDVQAATTRIIPADTVYPQGIAGESGWSITRPVDPIKTDIIRRYSDTAGLCIGDLLNYSGEYVRPLCSWEAYFQVSDAGNIAS
jgi:hypothetical protein